MLHFFILGLCFLGALRLSVRKGHQSEVAGLPGLRVRLADEFEPGAADRVHLYVDGEPTALVGAGPGAEPGPIELRLSKGEHTIVALVDNLGRFSDGNDLLPAKGLYDHLYGVKALKDALLVQPGPRSMGHFIDDQAIHSKLLLRFTDFDNLEPAISVVTHVRNGEVILAGFVDGDETRDAIYKATRKQDGVEKIHNEILLRN